MKTSTVDPHTRAGDPREQYLVTERDGKAITAQFVVIGDLNYANSVVIERQERAKRAPLRYPPNGAI